MPPVPGLGRGCKRGRHRSTSGAGHQGTSGAGHRDTSGIGARVRGRAGTGCGCHRAAPGCKARGTAGTGVRMAPSHLRGAGAPRADRQPLGYGQGCERSSGAISAHSVVVCDGSHGAVGGDGTRGRGSGRGRTYWQPGSCSTRWLSARLARGASLESITDDASTPPRRATYAGSETPTHTQAGRMTTRRLGSSPTLVLWAPETSAMTS
jgi:hypothetical protein